MYLLVNSTERKNNNIFSSQSLGNVMSELPENPDFFILAIIDKEFDAIKKEFSLQGPVPKEGREYYYGTISGPDGQSYSIVCTQSYDPGNISSGAATVAALRDLNPKYFLLVGIAGGVDSRNDIKLGDVVVSTEVEYYELQKETKGKKIDRSGVLANPSRSLLNTFKKIKNENWQADIKEERPEDKEKSPKAMSGLILSGEKLLGDENSELLNSLLEKHDKALAVEMEGAGVARAMYEESTRSKTEFLAIRGISDFCNVEGNQDARNKWRKYASASAANFAKNLIKNTNIDPTKQSLHEKYLESFSKIIHPKKKHEFNLKISIIDTTTIAANSLHDFVKDNHKVLLRGHAGGGKTGIVRRLSTYQTADGTVPIFIDLKQWNQGLSNELTEKMEMKGKMNIILKSSSIPISIEQIESFDKPYCIIIDGLNEISAGDFGDEIPRMIVNTLDEIVQSNINASALITDRLSPRDIFTAWKNLELLPIDEAEVKSVVDENFGIDFYDSLSKTNKEILETAFFLDAAIERKSANLLSKAGTIEDFFKNTLSISGTELDILAGLIFDATLRNKNLNFTDEDINRFGDQQVSALKASGVLRQISDGIFSFDHQLNHEFLLSHHLANHKDAWNNESFDSATLNSNSLESIYMTFEQITTPELADEFLLQVYDWNWKAALKSINWNTKLDIKNHSEEIVQAILVLVSVKKFDNVHGTSETVKKLLADPDSTQAQDFVKAKDLKEILEIAKSVNPKYRWINEWKSLLETKRDSEIGEDVILLIQSNNSVLGWTASNVLRECKLNDTNELQLRTIYRSSDANNSLHNTRRWRVVHALGMFPSRKNADLLFDALQDSYQWVRYGAARSLVEMAAITDDIELRGYILEKLTASLAGLNPMVLDEIGKAVFYKDATGSWKESVIPILDKAKSLSDRSSHTEKWQNIKTKFERGEWKSS